MNEIQTVSCHRAAGAGIPTKRSSSSSQEQRHLLTGVGHAAVALDTEGLTDGGIGVARRGLEAIHGDMPRGGTRTGAALAEDVLDAQIEIIGHGTQTLRRGSEYRA